MMTDRKDMDDLRTQDEKVWTARTIQTWFRTPKKTMKTVTIEEAKENFNNNNVNFKIQIINRNHLKI